MGLFGKLQDTMNNEDRLKSNQVLMSKNRKYKLVFQDDSNLVIYEHDGEIEKPIWASDTFGKKGTQFAFQTDGNLVIYEENGHPIWSPNIHGKGGNKLIMQDDGNLVVYRADNSPVWATNTHH